MLHNLIRGLTVLGNGPAIAYLVGGSLIGMVFGVIPGLGAPVILTIVLAFIGHINVTGTLSLFLATQAGSYFSASITSILLNTPAHPEAFAVTFDGFPMAQRGEAGRALGISATATCVGGIIGCIALVGFIQGMNSLPNIFHPPEMVGLIVIALLLVGTLGTDSVSKALISMGIALMIASIGADPITGINRYTFGSVTLTSGVSIVGLFLGLFAIPQMILVYGTGTAIARQNMMGEEIEAFTAVDLERGFGRQVLQGVRETFRYRTTLFVSSVIGVLTGVIPGIGGFAANFMSYGIAQQTSRDRGKFGTGIPQGIIAPEGSSLSKEAGGMVPIFGLGVPGGVGGALFLAALAIKGVSSGYNFATRYPVIPYESVWVIALGGIIGTVVGVLVAPLLARVTRVPGPVLVPFIMAISVVGAYVAEVSFYAVEEILLFTVVGFALRRLRYSLAAFGIGLVLGPTLETNIYLTHVVYHGAKFLDRPLTDVLLVIAIGLLLVKAVQVRRAATRRAVELRSVSDEEERLEVVIRNHPYPLLSLIATAAIAGVCVPFAVYGATHYDFTTAVMPVAGGSIGAVVALFRLPIDAFRYVDYRRAKRQALRLRTGDALLSPASEPGSAAIASGPQREPVSSYAAGSSRNLVGEELGGDDQLGALIASPAANDQPEIVDKSWGLHGQYAREFAAFSWFALLVAGTYLFGFVVAVVGFCALYGVFGTRRVFRNPISRLVFAVLSSATMGLTTAELQHITHASFGPVFGI